MPMACYWADWVFLLWGPSSAHTWPDKVWGWHFLITTWSSDCSRGSSGFAMWSWQSQPHWKNHQHLSVGIKPCQRR
jgi:hypothetical protein